MLTMLRLMIPDIENSNVLYKDSIYAAIGLAAPVLRDHLDFDTFLASTLVAEVQLPSPGYNILRRCQCCAGQEQWSHGKDSGGRKIGCSSC